MTAGSSSVSLSLAAAVSVATNTIDNDVRAHVLDSSLDAGGALDIKATSDKSIEAIGIAAAVSVTASSGTVAISGAFGAAIATNTIGGTVQALGQQRFQITGMKLHLPAVGKQYPRPPLRLLNFLGHALGFSARVFSKQGLGRVHRRSRVINDQSIIPKAQGLGCAGGTNFHNLSARRSG